MGMDERQPHILIVDDSDDDRVLYAAYLSRQGYRTSTASNGKEGVTKAFDLCPDLIVTDLWLPLLSGWDVMKRLKLDARTKHIPILVVTGNSLMRPPECSGMILKPCSLEDLGAEIARLLKTIDKHD